VLGLGVSSKWPRVGRDAGKKYFTMCARSTVWQECVLWYRCRVLARGGQRCGSVGLSSGQGCVLGLDGLESG
jgi:hypothetical protein